MKNWREINWVEHVGPGWKKLVEPLVERCKAENVGIAQVKEKFGGLRFYLNDHGSDELDRMIDEAESASYKVCEECGEPATRDSTGGWIKTLCQKHREERELEYKK